MIKIPSIVVDVLPCSQIYSLADPQWRKKVLRYFVEVQDAERQNVEIKIVDFIM
jgi:hypothetical protein